MSPAPARPDDGLLWDIAKTVVAMAFGAIASFVALRYWRRDVDRKLAEHDTRFASMRSDATLALLQTKNELRGQLGTLEREVAESRRNTERRLLFILEVLSDVANKIGANQRINDLAVRLLHKENESDD